MIAVQSSHFNNNKCYIIFGICYTIHTSGINLKRQFQALLILKQIIETITESPYSNQQDNHRKI